MKILKLECLFELCVVRFFEWLFIDRMLKRDNIILIFGFLVCYNN